MFEIKNQEDGALVITGRLDASQALQAEKLMNAIEASARVDLGGLDYISSAGIGVFVKTQLRLQAAGHALKLVNLHPRVRAIFHYAGLEQMFGIE
jgi:anti-sigma B factor antagonist